MSQSRGVTICNFERAKDGKEDFIGHTDMSWDTDELARLFIENKELPHHLGHYQMVREQSGHLR